MEIPIQIEKKLRIGLFVDSFPAYSEAWLSTQIMDLKKRGHQLYIFPIIFNEKFAFNSDFIEENIDKSVQYIAIPKSKYQRIINAVSIVFNDVQHIMVYLKTLNILKYGMGAINLSKFYQAVPFIKYNNIIDVFHSHYGTNVTRWQFLCEIGLFTNIPLIVSFYGYDAFFYDNSYYENLFKSNCKLIVLSNFLKDKLISLGASKKNIIKIPLAVNPYYIQNIPIPNFEQKATITIITVGRLCEFKGHEFSLQSLKILKDRGIENWEYLIVGDGELRDKLENCANILGIGNKIHFLGKQDYKAIYSLYSQADIFILTGIVTDKGEQETQGVVILEAQAMMLPVIVSDTGGCSEGLINGESGFLIPQKRPELVAEKLKLLINNPDLRKTMGVKGRDFVIKKYDINILNDKLINLYTEVIQENGL